MSRDQRDTENLACLSDPESVSLSHMANIDLYAAVCDRVCVHTSSLFWSPSFHCAPDMLALVSPVGHTVDVQETD